MRTRGRARLALAIATAIVVAAAAPSARAGQGEGYFYANDPKPIPDGHGNVSLPIQSTLPGDIDPKIDYVSISLRVRHARTRDLVVNLKRPDFDYTGMDPAQPDQRLVTLSDRDTRGKHLGEGPCPEVNPMSAPSGFTTLNDAGGPPYPVAPTPPQPLADGSAPYAGLFAPDEPLAGFNDYHHAPSGDPASPETWKLNVKDVRDGRAGKLLCAVLYLHRI